MGPYSIILGELVTDLDGGGSPDAAVVERFLCLPYRCQGVILRLPRSEHV